MRVLELPMRQGIVTSGNGPLWSGVEVEAYRVPGSRTSAQGIYVRAHATRYTRMREQLNRGRRVESEGEATEVVQQWTKEFTLWERGRRSPELEVLKQPWTQREVAALQRLSRRTPWRPLWAWIEDLASLMSIERGNKLYRLGDRLIVLGKPEGIW